MNNKNKTMIFENYVDSGTLILADPCYILGEFATNGVDDWQAFCDKIGPKSEFQRNMASQPLGAGICTLVSTGYGDGVYRVTVEKNSEGRVKKMTVTFIDDDT